MGQDNSTPIDESVPPHTLESRTIEAVAKFIKDGRAKNIVVMVSLICSLIFSCSIKSSGLLVVPNTPLPQCGAGISTSAGIPDFRSPHTGLYANLEKLNLPYAEAVFDISYFRTNPLPFYALAHELYPAKYKPTIAHLFLRLLSDKGLLLKVFTQNIDCLEREAGVPEDKIIEAHGSFAHQRCIDCKSDYPTHMMKEAIQNREVPRCLMPLCDGLVKPDIVFFGEKLPDTFHLNMALPGTADLCFIMGTSLSVQPFASLPGFCAEGVPRVLINQEKVGSLGSRADDVLLLGDCDSGVRMLAAAMDWAQELETLWTETNKTKLGPIQKQSEPSGQSFKDEYLDYQIAELTREVEQALKVSEDHDAMVRKSLVENRRELPIDKLSAKSPDTFAELEHSAGKSSQPPGQDPANTSNALATKSDEQVVADESTPNGNRMQKSSAELRSESPENQIERGAKEPLRRHEETASP